MYMDKFRVNNRKSKFYDKDGNRLYFISFSMYVPYEQFEEDILVSTRPINENEIREFLKSDGARRSDGEFLYYHAILERFVEKFDIEYLKNEDYNVEIDFTY